MLLHIARSRGTLATTIGGRPSRDQRRIIVVCANVTRVAQCVKAWTQSESCKVLLQKILEKNKKIILSRQCQMIVLSFTAVLAQPPSPVGPGAPSHIQRTRSVPEVRGGSRGWSRGDAVVLFRRTARVWITCRSAAAPAGPALTHAQASLFVLERSSVKQCGAKGEPQPVSGGLLQGAQRHWRAERP